MTTNTLFLFLMAIASVFIISPEIQGQVSLSQRRLTRGADTAEIYLNCLMYYDKNDIPWNGLFYSNNNGQSLSLKRKKKYWEEGGLLIGDSITGRIFQLPMQMSADTFGISYDYGINFEFECFPHIFYPAAGCMAGEIYIQSAEFPFGIYRSQDYGTTFACQSYHDSDSLELRDVGTLPGEVYGLNIYLSHGPLALTYSNDYGQTFTTSFIEFPETPIFDEVMIYRGTEPGEIFFVIVIVNGGGAFLYHTFDYGQTITFQSELNYPNGADMYTPGRAPGTFYVTQHWDYYDFSLLYIYFSRDYGVTFTLYFHELDSTYTQIPRPSVDLQSLVCYPNPVGDYLQINLPLNKEITEITLLDLYGQQQLTTTIIPSKTTSEIDVSTLPSGIYLVKVMQNNRMVGIEKVIVNK